MEYDLSGATTTSANKFRRENQTSLSDHDDVNFHQIGQTTLWIPHRGCNDGILYAKRYGMRQCT